MCVFERAESCGANHNCAQSLCKARALSHTTADTAREGRNIAIGRLVLYCGWRICPPCLAPCPPASSSCAQLNLTMNCCAVSSVKPLVCSLRASRCSPAPLSAFSKLALQRPANKVRLSRRTASQPSAAIIQQLQACCTVRRIAGRAIVVTTCFQALHKLRAVSPAPLRVAPLDLLGSTACDEAFSTDLCRRMLPPAPRCRTSCQACLGLLESCSSGPA